MNETLIGLIIGFVVGFVPPMYIHWQERKDKYLFAIIEKKFEVYQDAFTHSLVMRNSLNKDQSDSLDTDSIRSWFNRNNLYLNPEIRNDFVNIISCVERYGINKLIYLQRREDDSINDKKVEKSYNELVTTHEKIMELPKRIEDNINIYYKKNF